jgi:tetratricopeptide (TPR) repeat protein
MPQDAQGLALTAASGEAAAAYDRVIDGYLRYRLDTALHLKALLSADPEFGLGHVLKGGFAMLAYSAAQLPRARAALTDAMRLTERATPRERAHAAALGHWVEGDLAGALSTWEAILAEHPHDLLAFRLHHFNAFWLGRPERMLAAVEGTLPSWSAAIPGWGAMLACRCFANEECGNYTVAEAAGREAITLDPSDLWAAHAIAHVLEMQGRRAEGIAWLDRLEPHWEGGNNVKHHLWWHRAMFHMERREFDAVLDLYDRRFRDLASPVTQMQPDLYIDVQNAASMLLRLELRGLAVGERWTELADKAEARIGDCLSAFTLPHWMMALSATGRWAACERLLDGIREAAAANGGTLAPILRDVALPVSRGILHHRRGEHAEAVAAMRPALGDMPLLGGSHAQQDVLEQVFLDAAMKAGLHEDARLLLERVAGRHKVPPERRVGYEEAARRVAH